MEPTGDVDQHGWLSGLKKEIAWLKHGHTWPKHCLITFMGVKHGVQHGVNILK